MIMNNLNSSIKNSNSNDNNYNDDDDDDNACCLYCRFDCMGFWL
jgi:hypothetical protein